MKKAAIIILICAALLSVLLLVFEDFANAPPEGWGITVFLNDSNIPDYYPNTFWNAFVLPGQSLSVFKDVWDSYKHEEGSPFYGDVVNDAQLEYEDINHSYRDRFCYNSETGHLARHFMRHTFALRFEGIKPVLYKKTKYYVSFTVVSGDDKEKLDEIVEYYKRSVAIDSSIIVERTKSDPDDSNREPGYVDLSRTVHVSGYRAEEYPDAPDAVINYLKTHHHWSAIDCVRYRQNDTERRVYYIKVRVRWDETHDRIYVIEYDETADIIYSSEFEDIDPDNGAKSSQLYDEIYILPKLRKEADKIFPISRYYHGSDSIKLDYLPDDSCISHPPAGTTYAEFAKNCSDNDCRIEMSLRQISENVDIDIEAVKEFMIEHLIDEISVRKFDGYYVDFHRTGDTVIVN